MKKVVYTCITDGFKLHPVLNKKNGWDFICYSQSDTDCDGWDVRPIAEADIIIENDFIPNDRTKTARRIKILPHLFFSDYDLSLWIDSSLQFREEIDMDDIAGGLMNYDKLIMARSHPYRRCTYSEADVIVRKGLDSKENVQKIVARYKQKGYPVNYGLCETNFLLRKHNNPEMIRFANEWWYNVRHFSRRDQLSFNYTSWKLSTEIALIDDRLNPIIEKLSKGRNRGPFFNRTFHYYPTRTRKTAISSLLASIFSRYILHRRDISNER